MKIRAMRWGYDGGGMACGPVEGSTIVEICVTAERKNYFVTVSRMSMYEHIYISPVPAFDLLIQSNHYDVDFDTEYEKVTAHVVEDYDYEIGDEPEEMSASAFAKVIHLARLAMQECYRCCTAEEDYAGAQAFIKDYIAKEIDDMDLPELEIEVDEDEDDFK